MLLHFGISMTYCLNYSFSASDTVNLKKTLNDVINIIYIYIIINFKILKFCERFRSV